MDRCLFYVACIRNASTFRSPANLHSPGKASFGCDVSGKFEADSRVFRKPQAAVIQSLLRRIVVQVLPQPSFDFRYAHSFALAVVGNLITADLA